MNANSGNTPSRRQPRRLPKRPLFIIAAVIAAMLWVVWLTRSTPRPPPELPPLRELPLPLGGAEQASKPSAGQGGGN